MAYEGFIYLIIKQLDEMNNSEISKYQNIVLMKYSDDRPNYLTFIYGFKYFVETEAMCWKMRYTLNVGL